MRFAILLCAWTAAAFAQSPANYVEARAAWSGPGLYRYFEYTHTFKSHAVFDTLYIGNPGQNELFIGAGYQLQATPSVTVTPLLYFVTGKENRELGLVSGVIVLGSVQRWNVYSFLGYFQPLRESIPRYLYLDSLDVTRKFEHWEAGASAGFFVNRDVSSWLAGPVLVRNDALGAWRAYVRTGSTTEVRLSRTFGR